MDHVQKAAAREYPRDLIKLSDVDLWRALTLCELAMYGDDDIPEPPYDDEGNACIAEIGRRWGPEALERVATVITGGKFSPDDELRWLDRNPDSFMRLVRGETTPDDLFKKWYGKNED
ncbi:hypothetical protein [Amycolatopsis pigmentata]|uniref:Uncharacterized protein n=1 Tax=Amycolatopsis pigmentata TaxID=450801 RepID=A0ABW5G5T6_9PSEU